MKYRQSKSWTKIQLTHIQYALIGHDTRNCTMNIHVLNEVQKILGWILNLFIWNLKFGWMLTSRLNMERNLKKLNWNYRTCIWNLRFSWMLTTCLNMKINLKEHWAETTNIHLKSKVHWMLTTCLNIKKKFRMSKISAKEPALLALMSNKHTKTTL